MLRALLGALLRPRPAAPAEETQLGCFSGARAQQAARLFERLRGHGLQHIRGVVLTRNRSVLVSVRGFELRVHEGFVDAPTEMHGQIVRFVTAKRKWERQAARALRRKLRTRVVIDAFEIFAYCLRRSAVPKPRRMLGQWHRNIFNAR